VIRVEGTLQFVTIEMSGDLPIFCHNRRQRAHRLSRPGDGGLDQPSGLVAVDSLPQPGHQLF
jgi:hypothetical protein